MIELPGSVRMPRESWESVSVERYQVSEGPSNVSYFKARTFGQPLFELNMLLGFFFINRIPHFFDPLACVPLSLDCR